MISEVLMFIISFVGMINLIHAVIVKNSWVRLWKIISIYTFKASCFYFITFFMSILYIKSMLFFLPSWYQLKWQAPERCNHKAGQAECASALEIRKVKIFYKSMTTFKTFIENVQNYWRRRDCTGFYINNLRHKRSR